MALKGHRFRYFGLPSLEQAIEVVFHELLFEVFNPCRERNPRVIFLAGSCGKAIHPVAKSSSPDRFAPADLSHETPSAHR